ncbi:hypothetical protein BD309DRAFT_924301 [Dichomitus squalens]|uniref:Uncharacterized protein n=1 Tax=Dichomitus squalens TaxID=114155 RepID=A0A4V2K3V6_9APHY|nr:hypothetical protein BD309DRAFT_924301 [Dichomitus squalens]TBU52692.1 hypothetical protein BD310DRAFT_962464 [Dichomitus squalens]
MSIEAATKDGALFHEFVEGKELRLSLPNAGSSSSTAPALSCTIMKAFRPFTMSPVLLVSLIQPSTPTHGDAVLPTTAIIKLYDRRCLSNVRDEFDEGKPWSLDKEQEYRQYLDDVATGSVARGDFDSPTFMWDNDVSDGEFEAYLRRVAQRMFDAERTAYERLRDLQGKKIPRLYSVVEYEIAIPNARGDGAAVTDTIPGLLLEYVSSLSLRQLVATWTARNPPLANEVLAVLCEEAVKVVDRISDFDVLNEDVRVDNFLIREPFIDATSSTQGGNAAVVENAVVLIDLGLCRLRREDESEDEWIKAKWSQDEAGAVGFVLLGLVREFIGENVWKYERSLRYYRPLEE